MTASDASGDCAGPQSDNQDSGSQSRKNSEFDKDYFTGEATGSAYREGGYLDSALVSRLYFEMAENIARIFKPSKVLEVGCAIGPVVYYLNNFFGIEAHGVDVSEWAVENRLHENVAQGAVRDLKFADNEFDLIFSSHALEHLTLEDIDPAIKELDRVCKGVQFHLLPILGSPSYWDTFGAIVQLKRDPTHRLLFDRQWWTKRWALAGWHDSGLRVTHVHDNAVFEMSECQLLMTRDQLPVSAIEAIAMKNFATAAAYNRALNCQPPPGLETYLSEICARWKN